MLAYRCVVTDPPTSADFLTYHELGKRVSLKARCDACGLSIMGSMEDAIHLLEAIPGVYKHVARAKLMPDHGMTKPTPIGQYPTHISWWSYLGIDRCGLFSIIMVS